MRLSFLFPAALWLLVLLIPLVGIGWWPAQRPDIVYLSNADFTASPRKHQAWTRNGPGTWPSGAGGPDGAEFIEHYYKLGIVRPDPPFIHVERERAASVP